MKSCQNCQSSNVYIIDVFRHRWTYCKDCRCAFTEANPKPPFWSNFIPRRKPSLKLFLSGKFDATTTYDQYASEERKQKVIKIAADNIATFKNDYGIDVTGKRVLDISGGNAHYVLQYRLAGASRIVFTEFGEALVNYAANLDIPGHVFDLNGPQPLESLINEKFDLIIFKGNSMFTLDLPRLFKSFQQLLSDEGRIVIFDNHEYTEALAVRWCHHRYTHKVCWSTEVFEKNIKDGGFKIMYKRPYKDIHYWSIISGIKSAFYATIQKSFKKQVAKIPGLPADSPLHSEHNLPTDYVLAKA